MSITTAQRSVIARVSQHIDQLEALVEMMGGLSEKTDMQYMPCAVAVNEAIQSTAKRLDSEVTELQSVHQFFDCVLDLQLETCMVDAGVAMLNHLFGTSKHSTGLDDFRRMVDFCSLALEDTIQPAKEKVQALKAAAKRTSTPATSSTPTAPRRRSKAAEKALA